MDSLFCGVSNAWGGSEPGLLNMGTKTGALLPGCKGTTGGWQEPENHLQWVFRSLIHWPNLLQTHEADLMWSRTIQRQGQQIASIFWNYRIWPPVNHVMELTGTSSQEPTVKNLGILWANYLIIGNLKSDGNTYTTEIGKVYISRLFSSFLPSFLSFLFFLSSFLSRASFPNTPLPPDPLLPRLISHQSMHKSSTCNVLTFPLTPGCSRPPQASSGPLSFAHTVPSHGNALSIPFFFLAGKFLLTLLRPCFKLSLLHNILELPSKQFFLLLHPHIIVKIVIT